MNVLKQILFHLVLLLGGAALFMAWAIMELLNDSVSNMFGLLWTFGSILLLILTVALPMWYFHIKKKGFGRGIAFTVLCFCLFSVVLFTVHGGVHHYMSTFSPQKWEKYEHDRYKMISSLEKEYYFIGMTKEEVQEILGEGDFFYASPETEDSLEYYLGVPGFIDPEMLTFEFEEEKAVRVYTYIEIRGEKNHFYKDEDFAEY